MTDIKSKDLTPSPQPEQLTPGLKVPLLSEQQIQALFERDDHGVNPAVGLWRYPTLEDWMVNGGIKGKNNFHYRFSDGMIPSMHRESQWFQRFALLYPEQLERLMQTSETLFRDPSKIPETIDESTEHDYWSAYERLADLVDKNDAMINGVQGSYDLPPGHAAPSLLSA